MKNRTLARGLMFVSWVVAMSGGSLLSVPTRAQTPGVSQISPVAGSAIPLDAGTLLAAVTLEGALLRQVFSMAHVRCADGTHASVLHLGGQMYRLESACALSGVALIRGSELRSPNRLLLVAPQGLPASVLRVEQVPYLPSKRRLFLSNGTAQDVDLAHARVALQ